MLCTGAAFVMKSSCLVLQSNLSVAEMLYSGHLLIGDTFSWKRSNHGQTLIENPYIADTFIEDNCYSGHNLLAPCEKFKSIYLFIADTPYLYFLKNKNKLLLDFQVFVFDNTLFFYIYFL